MFRPRKRFHSFHIISFTHIYGPGDKGLATHSCSIQLSYAPTKVEGAAGFEPATTSVTGCSAARHSPGFGLVQGTREWADPEFGAVIHPAFPRLFLAGGEGFEPSTIGTKTRRSTN